jgi:hypothetical protein
MLKDDTTLLMWFHAKSTEALICHPVVHLRLVMLHELKDMYLILQVK